MENNLLLHPTAPIEYREPSDIQFSNEYAYSAKVVNVSNALLVSVTFSTEQLAEVCLVKLPLKIVR